MIDHDLAVIEFGNDDQFTELISRMETWSIGRISHNQKAYLLAAFRTGNQDRVHRLTFLERGTGLWTSPFEAEGLTNYPTLRQRLAPNLDHELAAKYRTIRPLGTGAHG